MLILRASDCGETKSKVTYSVRAAQDSVHARYLLSKIQSIFEHVFLPAYSLMLFALSLLNTTRCSILKMANQYLSCLTLASEFTYLYILTILYSC